MMWVMVGKEYKILLRKLTGNHNPCRRLEFDWLLYNGKIRQKWQLN